MKIFYYKDADVEALKKKQIAVIGYGSQGFAQSNNLKDSGCNVTVGLRPGSASWEKAEQAGLKVKPVAEAAAEADIVMMLVPDELAPDIYAREVAESITPGKYLAFSHGFSIHFNFIAARACLACSLSARIRPAIQSKWAWRMRQRSEAGAQVLSKPASVKKRRQTCSANKRCSAAG